MIVNKKTIINLCEALEDPYYMKLMDGTLTIIDNRRGAGRGIPLDKKEFKELINGLMSEKYMVSTYAHSVEIYEVEHGRETKKETSVKKEKSKVSSYVSLYQCLDCKRVFTDNEMNINLYNATGRAICPDCKGGRTVELGEVKE